MYSALGKMLTEVNRHLKSAHRFMELGKDYALILPKNILDESPYTGIHALCGKSTSIECQKRYPVIIVECFIVDESGQTSHCYMTLNSRLENVIKDKAICFEDTFAKVVGVRYKGLERSKGFEFSRVNHQIPFDTAFVKNKFFTSRQQFKDLIDYTYEIIDSPDVITRGDIYDTINKLSTFVGKVNQEDLYFLNGDLDLLIDKYESRIPKV